jgi:hypothetical protein
MFKIGGPARRSAAGPTLLECDTRDVAADEWTLVDGFLDVGRRGEAPLVPPYRNLDVQLLAPNRCRVGQARSLVGFPC